MVAVIDALLKTGSDVNAKTTTDEDTVLHLVIKHAVLRLAFQTCLMILEHKPDLDIRNRVRVKRQTLYNIEISVSRNMVRE